MLSESSRVVSPLTVGREGRDGRVRKSVAVAYGVRPARLNAKCFSSLGKLAAHVGVYGAQELDEHGLERRRWRRRRGVRWRRVAAAAASLAEEQVDEVAADAHDDIVHVRWQWHARGRRRCRL